MRGRAWSLLVLLLLLSLTGGGLRGSYLLRIARLVSLSLGLEGLREGGHRGGGESARHTHTGRSPYLFVLVAQLAPLLAQLLADVSKGEVCTEGTAWATGGEEGGARTGLQESSGQFKRRARIRDAEGMAAQIPCPPRGERTRSGSGHMAAAGQGEEETPPVACTCPHPSPHRPTWVGRLHLVTLSGGKVHVRG